MPLLPLDEAFLLTKGFSFEILPGPQGEQFLVLREVLLASGRYDHKAVDVLVKLLAGYPVTALDMFWVKPHLRLANGPAPPSAETYETLAGESWQRFSRHLPGGAWRPGVDSLRTFLPLILTELTQP